MRPVFAVVYLGRSRMDVVAEDSARRRRKVRLTWLTKAATDVPPANWLEQLEGELSLQDSDRTKGIG